MAAPLQPGMYFAQKGMHIREGGTLLTTAVYHKEADKVRQLIQAKKDLNEVSSYGDTALTLAASMGHFEIVCILVEAKADVNLANRDGKNTPLHCAMVSNAQNIVQYLLKQPEIDAKKTNAFGKTYSEATIFDSLGARSRDDLSADMSSSHSAKVKRSVDVKQVLAILDSLQQEDDSLKNPQK